MTPFLSRNSEPSKEVHTGISTRPVCCPRQADYVLAPGVANSVFASPWLKRSSRVLRLALTPKTGGRTDFLWEKPRRNLTRWPRLRGHGRGGTRQGARNSSLQVPAHRSLPPSSASRFIEARRRAARSAALRTSLRRHRRISKRAYSNLPTSMHELCTIRAQLVYIAHTLREN